MEIDEFQQMSDNEESMWWYRSLHANLLFGLQRVGLKFSAPILDAGCGTGGLLNHLGGAAPDLDLIGLDLNYSAAALARKKCGAEVTVASVDDMPFGDGMLSGVVFSDVLCHKAVDPTVAVGEAYRCLARDGFLIVQVPAYDWLLSYHDEKIHNSRRYTKKRLTKLLREKGFSIEYCAYWNTILFPLMVIRRKILKPRDDMSDVRVYPPLLEAIFGMAMTVERSLMRFGLRMPFGGSVLAVGIKYDR